MSPCLVARGMGVNPAGLVVVNNNDSEAAK